MSKIKKQQETVILERYHGPLITNGVGLGYIKIFPWINFFVSLLFYSAAKFNGVNFIENLFLCCLVFSIISIIYSFFNIIIEKFNVLTYIFLSITFFITLVGLDFISLMMLVGGDDFHSSTYSFVFKLFSFIFLVFSLIMTFFVYPYFYRRDRLTNGAYREKESKFNSEDNKLFSSNFLLIFGLVVFVPPLLTGYLENVFGLVIGILFSLVFPALVVDAFYAALYAKQHPEEIDEL
ncbi:hypothetical protein [Streptococcus equinus]|uniref:hypothetical protein n=1 Tax=Streptococcus equinus TaxID=1335 RepID=UPI000884A482|nr:hypothetical protein [Streptococcus equinus]SDQ14474.1 hypothetical protein SAMN05216407_0435 [Streptococcus equinus]